MKQQSNKMARLNSEYSKLRKKWLPDHEMCQAKVNRCTLKSTDIHHMKGRGKYLLDTNTWLSVCRNCHTWIELNPEDSKELGISISKII